jgi:hypothetical protein
MLKTQLILKGIIAPEDWDDMEEHIQYDFLFDNHFNELKQMELMKERIGLVTQMDPFVGKYISSEYIRKQVLMQTEKEYTDMDKQMKKDIESGLALNPIDTNILTQKSLENDAYAPEIANAEADAEAERKIDLEKAKPKPAPKSSSNKGSNK